MVQELAVVPPPPPLPGQQDQQNGHVSNGKPNSDQFLMAPHSHQRQNSIPTEEMSQLTISRRAVHVPLARCRVLYLGSAVPTETAVGLEAVQQPLKERYPARRDGEISGIDAWLTVYSSGMQLQYVADSNQVTWFPIQTLHVCAAVKCVTLINGATGESHPKFISLDSEGAAGSSHPPMFASIMRRTIGIKVLECHVFICKSNQAAMALVQSCTHAYEHKEGWTDEAPPAEVFQGDLVSPNSNGTMHLVPAEPVNTETAPPEFYQQPPDQGYFYASNKQLVKNYNVFGGRQAPTTVPRPQGPTPARLPPPGPRPAGPPLLAGPGSPPPGLVPPPGTLIRGPPPGTLVRSPPPLMVPAPPPAGPPVVMGPPVPYDTLPPPRGLPMGPPFPPPPAGYFADWEMHAGQPIVVYPQDGIYGGGRRREKKKRKEHRKRSSSGEKHKSSGSRNHHRERRHHHNDHKGHYSDEGHKRDSRERRHHSPERRKTRHHSHERHYQNSSSRRPPQDSRRRRSTSPSSSDEYYRYERERRRQERPRTPPADYQRRHSPERRSPERRDHHQDYHDRNRDYQDYNRDYQDRKHDRRDRNPEVYYREMEAPDDTYSHHIETRDRPEREYHRHFPRSEKEFGLSMEEERRAIGDAGAAPDPYQLNGFRYQDDDSQINMDMFNRRNGRGKPYDNLEQSLGYYP